MALYSRQFFHGLNKKYIAAFGMLFSDLEVLRFDNDGYEVQRERVPIDYAQKEKWFRNYHEDPEFQRPISIKLPRMSWELISWQFDPFRAQNNNIAFSNPLINFPDGNTKRFFTPIPYDLTFSLNIITKSVDDMHQIMEQIVPAFKPDVTMRMEIIKELGYEMDVSVNLVSIASSDSYQGKLQELRLIESTMTFVLKGWFVGPVRDVKVIKKSIVNLHDKDTGNRIESIGVAPFNPTRANISSVLSTDEYEFLYAAGYFATDQDVVDELNRLYQEKLP